MIAKNASPSGRALQRIGLDQNFGRNVERRSQRTDHRQGKRPLARQHLRDAAAAERPRLKLHRDELRREQLVARRPFGQDAHVDEGIFQDLDAGGIEMSVADQHRDLRVVGL